MNQKDRPNSVKSVGTVFIVAVMARAAVFLDLQQPNRDIGSSDGGGEPVLLEPDTSCVGHLVYGCCAVELSDKF